MCSLDIWKHLLNILNTHILLSVWYTAQMVTVVLLPTLRLLGTAKILNDQWNYTMCFKPHDQLWACHGSSRASYRYTKDSKVVNMFITLLKALHVSDSGFEFTVGTMTTDIHLSTQGYLKSGGVEFLHTKFSWRVVVSVAALDLHYVETVLNGQLNTRFANCRSYNLFWIQKHPTRKSFAAQHFCQIKPF